jgi:CheY-like chemotaxis protein
MLHCNPVTRHIPQILISGSPMLANYAELAEVNGMLRKPFELAQLLSLISSFW